MKLIFAGYIKSLLSELWSVLECGPLDTVLFTPKHWPVDPIERASHKVNLIKHLFQELVNEYLYQYIYVILLCGMITQTLLDGFYNILVQYRHVIGFITVVVDRHIINRTYIVFVIKKNCYS